MMTITAPDERKLEEAMAPRETIRLAVIMTCFNRCEKTTACLQRLFTQQAVENLQLTVYLLDDGSSDGTAETVRQRWPAVHLLQGDGSLFWNRGMHRAFAEALQRGFDAYLWLNDDTMLLPHALCRLVDAWLDLRDSEPATIVAGSTYDAASGRWSYGGFRWRKGWRRGLEPAEPAWEATVPCDTMNGNFTLIPHAVAAQLGNLEAGFQHSFGDFDYGLRARAEGMQVVVAPGFYGSCSDNARSGTWRDRGLPLRRRWHHLRSPKGSPFGQWSMYCRRHLGVLWPMYVASPYLRVLVTSIRFPHRTARS